LTLTGVYLWAVPLIRKRRSARERATAVVKNKAGELQAAPVEV
jgi:hypothetical protein